MSFKKVIELNIWPKCINNVASYHIFQSIEASDKEQKQRDSREHNNRDTFKVGDKEDKMDTRELERAQKIIDRVSIIEELLFLIKIFDIAPWLVWPFALILLPFCLVLTMVT